MTGPITFVNHAEGWFRVNGNPGDAATGAMVRLDDPTSRHTILRGAGCASVDAASGRVPDNCSADPRFTLDPDNSGYPLCIRILPASYAVGLCGCIDGTVAPETDISWLTVQVVQP